MEKTDFDFWFKKKEQRFLKNIDTFYYSVYFDCDLSSIECKDVSVFNYREYLGSLLNLSFDTPVLFANNISLLYSRGCFEIYKFRLSAPDFFDLFLTDKKPTSDTPDAIIQLRSNCLWIDGVYNSFRESFKFVTEFLASFGISIKDVRENRCDFACHSNYLKDPEKFFDRDNFAKMWVGRVGRTKEHVKEFINHTTVYDDDSIETDYIAIGKRGSKCFIRIYLKSKEVVQQGYKEFFFHIWREQGLISEYDLFCLNEAYEMKSWSFLDVARLEWAYIYDDRLSQQDRDFIKNITRKPYDYDIIRRTANLYTPKVTKIFNIEFQVMRDMSKTFELIKKNKGVDARIYDYLDNYSIIYEYLTRESFRLVRPDVYDINKSRRPNIHMWDRLRTAKTIYFRDYKPNTQLLRKYCHNINADIRKKRAINAITSFSSLFEDYENKDIIDDAETLINYLNDNDIEYINKKRLENLCRKPFYV